MLSVKKSMQQFYTLKDAEDYFDFFNLKYDEKLLNVKRFHILKEYGILIRTGMKNIVEHEEQLLDFLKYSLIKVYGKFSGGYAPSAADVWNMFKDGKLSGCMACTPQKGNSCGC